MKKLSTIVDKWNVCQLLGWNEKRGGEIRLEFYADAQAGDIWVSTCEPCIIRLNDLPNLCHQQAGSSEYGPKAMSGLG